MSSMKYHFILAILFFSLFLKGQTSCGPAYMKIINQADLNLKQGLFKKAFEGYRAARGCKEAKLAYIDNQMSACLDSIEKQRIKLLEREKQLGKTLNEIQASKNKLERTQLELKATLSKAQENETAAKIAAETARKAEAAAKEAESKVRELFDKNAQSLEELRKAYTEKINELRKQAIPLLSKLNFDTALQIITKIHDIPGGKEQTENLLFECAFFYSESGQMEKAQEVFGLLGKSVLPNREAISEFLKSQNFSQYNALMELYYPSFTKITGGYFLGGFIESRDQFDRVVRITKEFTEHYKVGYKLVNTVSVNKAPITNRQFYLFSQTDTLRSIGVIDAKKSFKSKEECIQYLNWLSIQFGKTPFYSIKNTPTDPKNISIDVIKNSNGFRLPTNDEWEYVVRIQLGQILPLNEQTLTKEIASTIKDFSRKRPLNYFINVNKMVYWCHDSDKNKTSLCDNVLLPNPAIWPIVLPNVPLVHDYTDSNINGPMIVIDYF